VDANQSHQGNSIDFTFLDPEMQIEKIQANPEKKRKEHEKNRTP